MTWINISNLNADSMEPPLKLFWRSALFTEIAALEDMLFADAPVPKKQPNFDEETWHMFMCEFLECIPDHQTDISDLRLAPLTQTTLSKALRWRIRQALYALSPLPLEVAAAHPPQHILPSHTVLLPMRLKARLALVLGHADLPMVWIRTIDLQQMPAPQKRPQCPE